MNKRPADGNGDVARGVLGLSDGDTDELSADVREKRVGQGAPETKEDRKMVVVDLLVEILPHGAIRVVPVAEAEAVVLGVPAEVDDDTHEDETDECDDFDAAEPELKFAEDAYAEEVYTEN